MTKRVFTDVEMEMQNVEQNLAVDVGGVFSVSSCAEIIQYYDKELVSEMYFATEDMKQVMFVYATVNRFIRTVGTKSVYIVDNSFMNMLIGIPRYEQLKYLSTLFYMLWCEDDGVNVGNRDQIRDMFQILKSKHFYCLTKAEDGIVLMASEQEHELADTPPECGLVPIMKLICTQFP